MIDIVTKAKLEALMQTAKTNYRVLRFRDRDEAGIWRIVGEELYEILREQKVILPTGQVLDE